MIAHSAPEISSVAESPRGPWSAEAERRRALDDMRVIAKAMSERQRDPSEILHMLLRQAALWRQTGAPVNAETPLAIMRQLPGLADYDPIAAWQESLRGTGAELVAGLDDPDGDEAEDVRRQEAERALDMVVINWFLRHLGTPDTRAARHAIERDLARYVLEQSQ
jgi:hypothetical protein